MLYRERKPRKEQYKRPFDYIPTVYKETDLAYLAGIIDGEGCFFIGIVKKQPNDGYISTRYKGMLKIANTDRRLIDWILNTFEGSESTAFREVRPGDFKQPIYDWIATGDRLLNLCEAVLPYLVIKKRHCEIMIEFRKTYIKALGDHTISKEILDARQRMLEEIRPLNSRYHYHPLKSEKLKKNLALVTGS